MESSGEIRVENINKSYGEKVVLSGFSAGFEYGKCTAIMGMSGRGKTTFLRILMGLDKDYSGQVLGMPEHFAVVFQEDRLCNEFSVISNIRMVMRNEGTAAGSLKSNKDNQAATGSLKSNKDAEIIKCLTELGLQDCLYNKVAEISGGQKRRVAIARALMYDGDLIIMDEPFKGLDEETRKLAVAAVLKRKKTIIMVTHDAEEVRLMDAKVIEM